MSHTSCSRPPWKKRQLFVFLGVLLVYSRILLFSIRLDHSHPVAELLLRLLLAVLASHRARPAHLGKDRSQVKDSVYRIVTNRFLPQQNVKMGVVGSAAEAELPVDWVDQTQHVPEVKNKLRFGR